MNPEEAAQTIDFARAPVGAFIKDGTVTEVVGASAVVSVDGGGTARPTILGFPPAPGQRVTLLFDPANNGTCVILGTYGGTPPFIADTWTTDVTSGVSAETTLTGLTLGFRVDVPDHLLAVHGHVRINPSTTNQRAILRCRDDANVLIGIVAEVQLPLDAEATLDGLLTLGEIGGFPPGGYLYHLTLEIVGGGSAATTGYCSIGIQDHGPYVAPA